MQGTPYTMVSPPKNGGAAELLYPTANAPCARSPARRFRRRRRRSREGGRHDHAAGRHARSHSRQRRLPDRTGGLASFGYQYDDDLHFKIEVGYMIDRYRIAGGDLQVKTVPIMLALDTVLVRGQSVTVYGGGGIGYSLNTGTRQGISNEANSTAAYLALGLRFHLAGPVAMVLEDRYTLSTAQVDAQSQRKLTVGGNLFSFGLMFHFLEPDEKGKPTGR